MREEEELTVVPANNPADATSEVAPNLSRKLKDELSKFLHSRSMESKRWGKQSIYRIPQNQKEVNGSSAYQPQTVSIGPYHHGEPQLESMEEHKRRALLTFLYRSQKPFHLYLAVLAPVVDDLRDAYQQLDPKWKDDTEAFLELMVVDGCFILEIMRTATGSGLGEMGYAVNDPVFSNHGELCFVPYLKRDMLMLENQLPLHLLYKLLLTEDAVPISNGYSKKKELSVLILRFFSLPHKFNLRKYKECLHLLDLYRRSMVSGFLFRKSIFKKLRWSSHNIRDRSWILECFSDGEIYRRLRT